MSNITIKDLAKITGVSTQTISRVVNNKPSVKKETREKVLKSIEEYGYRPNLYAKNLVNKKDKSVLILLKRSSDHLATIWTNHLVSTLIKANKHQNLNLLVEQYYSQEELENSIMNRTNFIDGVIIFYEQEDDQRVKMLKRNKIPYVVFGKSREEESIYVSNTDYESVVEGMEYLFEKGHTNIDFISANKSPLNGERERGAVGAYEKNNISREKLRIVKGINTEEDIIKYVDESLEKDNLPDALFVSGDEKAIVIMSLLNEKGIKVPSDISILGFDNIIVSKYTIPSLSTIALDYRSIADKLLEKIINMIDGKVVKSEEIKGNIIKRNSVK